MNYRVIHKTEYAYGQNVDLCHNEARLKPRDFSVQHSEASWLEIEPAPSVYRERLDFWGNRVAYFAIQRPHNKLTVTATSQVSLALPATTGTLVDSPDWEQVCAGLANTHSIEWLEARPLVLDTPLVATGPELEAYARPSFTAGRPLLEAVRELTERIFEDFAFDPSFTTVSTPLLEVLKHRRGVCQDFAHLGLGCLRSMGLAARYVSGYIETVPPPGKERLVGADASHAWFSVYTPGSGWVDFDPTNNQMPTDQHITVAWGRDYTDVVPLKGVLVGGGDDRLAVSVDVERLAD